VNKNVVLCMCLMNQDLMFIQSIHYTTIHMYLK